MLKKTVKVLYERRRKFYKYIAEKRNIKKKKNLIKKVTLNKEQIKEIDDIWMKNYGKKISKDWHKLYTSYLGVFNKYYFPEIFFTTNLLDKLNPHKRRISFDDKILTNYFLKDIQGEKYKLITNHIYNCNGYYYNERRNNKLRKGHRYD